MSDKVTETEILQAEKLFKTLGDKTRLKIVLLLKEQEYNVTALSNVLDMEQSAVSHQLKSLKNERLVKSRREGKSIYYELEDKHVYAIIEQVIAHIKE